jgi:hypothetical protein
MEAPGAESEGGQGGASAGGASGSVGTGGAGTGGAAGRMNTGGGGSGTGGMAGQSANGGGGGSAAGGTAGNGNTGGAAGTGTGGAGTGGKAGTGGTGTGGTGTGGTGTGGMGIGGAGGLGTGGTGTGGLGSGGTGTGGLGSGGTGTGGKGGAGGMNNGGAGGKASGGAGGQSLPSLWAYYPFDQSGGTTITDASGNGRNGTLSGTTTTFPSGVIGNAISLKGDSDYVTLPAGFIQTLTDITITCWVNVHTDQTWQRVFDFGSSQNVYMFLTSHAGGANARFAISTTGNTGGEQQLNGNAVLPTGTWTHVAIVLGPSGGALYVNGALVSSNTALTLRPKDLGATANTYIGRSQFAVDPYFNGEIDDMRVYASALTAAQITTIYNAR